MDGLQVETLFHFGEWADEYVKDRGGNQQQVRPGSGQLHFSETRRQFRADLHQRETQNVACI